MGGARYIWTEGNDNIIRKNYTTKTNIELAKMIGCSSKYVSDSLKRLGLDTRRNVNPLITLEDCTNSKKINGYYHKLRYCPTERGIDSDIKSLIYQNNKSDITICTRQNGILRVKKSDLKQLIDELTEIYQVYVEET